MSIEKNIEINTHYTRSINLERDSDSLAVVDAYIPTSRAISTFERLTETFGKISTPRSWSLVGPYGSGKSSFAVFLSHLMTEPTSDSFKAAKKVLKTSDKTLARKFDKELKDTSGYCKVLLTGSPEPLAQRFVASLYDAAATFWSTRRGPAHAIVTELEKLSKKKDPKVSSIIENIKKLQDALAKAKCAGLLVVFDELGKFLEYEARHPDGNDIYLLQSLAEHAVTGHDTNLYIYVLLHQAFDKYAKGLGESLKNEWAKVQGRYENIPFLESLEQILRVVSAAFTHTYDAKNKSKINEFSKKAASTLAKNDALPSVMTVSAATDIFSGCYPLHPISALLLPILCQKVAQNERTLFSYLGSQEKHGFKDSLKTIENIGEWIYPWEIYDYFILNQPAALADHFTHRRWAEVVTSIERLGDAEPEQVNLLKTIGLLNIVGVHGGFKASKSIIELCLPKKSSVKKATDKLIKQSIIQYRKFSGEFRVWQGSDFDLEAALNDEITQQGRIELAYELNNRKSLLPLVARKYTIQNGTLRYFQPVFIDTETCLTQPVKDKTPRILFFLAETTEDKAIFKNKVVSYYSELDITVFCNKGTQLRQAVTDVMALHRVQTNRQELHSDPIAQREYYDRAAAAEDIENELLTSLTAYPEDSDWYWKEEKLKVKQQRDLQFIMSDILKSSFSKCPVIHNEMINRDLPSSQANSARNKLLYAMMNHAELSELGIKLFPPEKAIYLSVLREMKLHNKDTQSKDGAWKFVAPTNKSMLYHVWKRIDAFFDSTEKQAKSLVELNTILLAPPYGVKAGVLPILYIAAYIVNQDELALFEKKRYKSYFTEEMIERFVKRPDEFFFQRFKNTGKKEIQLQLYAKLFDKNIEISTAVLFRSISNKLSRLPNYSLHTSHGISQLTKTIRDAFFIDESPEEILINIIPDLFSSYGSKITASKIIEVFNELEESYDKLILLQSNKISIALRLSCFDDISLFREKIVELLTWMEPYTKNIISLKSFVIRVMQRDIDDKEWLENILMFLAKKQVKEWQDKDIKIADEVLQGVSSRLLDVEENKIKETREHAKIDSRSNVYLLSCLKKNGEQLEESITIEHKYKEEVDEVVAGITILLKDTSEDDKAMILAKVTYEYLSYYKSQKNHRVK